jgi:hypothetical protein
VQVKGEVEGRPPDAGIGGEDIEKNFTEDDNHGISFEQ